MKIYLQLRQDGGNPVILDIDYPTASPQSQASLTTPLDSPRSPEFVVPARSTDRFDRDPQEWVSPAFLKRKNPSSTLFVNSIYDPFDCGHDYRETSPSKRSKFGRKSREWRFADQSPSPVAEDDIGIFKDCGMTHEVVKQKTVVEDPPAIQAELQTHRALKTDAEPPVAVISSSSIFNYHEETFQSDERSSGDLNGDISTVSDASFAVSSSQIVSPDPPDVEFKSKEHILPIQDTYGGETVSASSPTADPSMEAVTSTFYGEKHAAGEDSSSAKQNSSLLPAQVQSSTNQPSRSTGSFSNNLEMSEHDLAVHKNNVGSKIIQNELAGDEHFSKGAYTPFETDDFDTRSEHLEMVEILSDDEIDDQRHDDGLVNSADKVNLPSADIIPPFPSPFDHQSLTSSRARRHTRSVSISRDQASEMATAVVPHTSPGYISTSVDDSNDGSGPENKIEEKTQWAGLEQVLNVPAIFKKQMEADAEEQLPITLARSALPLGKSNKTKISLSGSIESIEDIAERQGQDVVDDPLDMSSGRGAMRESKLPIQEEHEASQSVVDSQDKNNEACLGNDQYASGQRIAIALSPKMMSSNDEGKSEDSGVTDDGNALIESQESVSSDNRSRAESVEIIDLDEYEGVESPEEKSDLAHSVEGDHWSDEELQYQTEFRSESEDDDEFSSGDEGGSFTDEYEEDDMREEDPALIPNTFEQSGHGQYFRSDLKTPHIEIIDLESDDDIESTRPFSDDRNVPQASSMTPNIEGISNTKVVLTLDGDHSRAIDLAQEENRHQPEVDNDIVAPEQPQTLVKSRSGPRVEVQDTYSEDAALSDTESSESLLAMQVEGKTRVLQRLTESSPDASTIAQNLPASKDLNIEVKEQQIPKSKSHVRQGEGHSVTLSSSSTNEERIAIHGNDDSVEPMHSQDQEFAVLPVQHDELPSTQPRHTFEQKNQDMLKDDEFYSSRNALSVTSIEHEQESPKHNDEDLNEQGVREYQSKDLRKRFTLRSQLLTPSDTQSTTVNREPSNISRVSQDEQNTFPTPSLTQRTSDILAPITPMLRRPTLIEKLKEMRSNSARKRQASLSDELLTGVSPWFGEGKSSHLRPLSDHESLPGAEEETGRDGDVSSEAEQSELDREPTLPIRRAVTPPMSSVFTRLPSSSPPAHSEPEHGFRTSLSYFAPLSTLRSHYNSTTSVLALVIASTLITRAAAGPKDFHMTLYVTDPSSSSPPSVTSARLFRPSKFPFPEARQGDAILLRNFRVVSYRKQLGLLSTDSSAWAVFRRGEEPQIRGPPVEFGAEERGFARGHWDWWGAVQQDKYINAVPENKAQRQGREFRNGKGRSSIVRHELRDGTTYVDRPKVENTAMHELRDGTQWSDSKL